MRSQARYDEIDEVEKKSPEEIVDDFYQLVNGTPLSEKQKKMVAEILEKIWEGER